MDGGYIVGLTMKLLEELRIIQTAFLYLTAFRLCTKLFHHHRTSAGWSAPRTRCRAWASSSINAKASAYVNVRLTMLSSVSVWSAPSSLGEERNSQPSDATDQSQSAHEGGMAPATTEGPGQAHAPEVHRSFTGVTPQAQLGMHVGWLQLAQATRNAGQQIRKAEWRGMGWIAMSSMQ